MKTMTGRATLESGTRALLLTWMAVALAAALGVAASLSASKAEAAPKFKTVTKTFGVPSQIETPAFGPGVPYPSDLSVGGLKRGRITDVNLTLKNFNHDGPDQVDVMLVSPSGRNRTVLSDAGEGTDIHGITVVLDDEAEDPLPEFEAISAGAFKPTNHSREGSDPFPFPAPDPGGLSNLSGFDGANPNGTWKLFVVDDRFSNPNPRFFGFAGGWSLQIKARVRR